MHARFGAVLAAAVLVGGLLAGCGGGGSDDDDDPQAGATTGASAGALPGDGGAVPGGATGAGAAGEAATKVVPGDSLFMVLKLSGWQLGEAVRPIGKSRPQFQQLDKSLDWYATYDKPSADQSVTINGHLRGLAGQSTILKRDGAGKLQTGEINGRQASWLDQKGGNVVVLIALAPNYTIELIASGVDLQDTLAIARALTPTNEAAWKAAGGKIVDCLAAGQECIGA